MTAPPRSHASTTEPRERGRSLSASGLIGIGLMAGVDVVVFHQVLAWHHFYDRSTTNIAMISDGLVHLAELVILVVGFLLLADLSRRHALAKGPAWAGLFLGLGGFQLWDGLVHHKLLRLHQVRYGVDTLPYDLAWNAGGVVLLAIGTGLALRSRRERRSGEANAS